MKVTLQKFLVAFFISSGLFSTVAQAQTGEHTQPDPWKRLQEAFPEEEQTSKDKENHDPWAELRRVYLPFTEAEEEEAVTDARKAKSFSRKLLTLLQSYRGVIRECSQRFKVPQEIVGAVILVESGGNPRAAAKTSSARGLMQTIKRTFKHARESLKKQGIHIANDPFDPRSSIYAGTWYLNYVFDRASRDNGGNLCRERIRDWHLPAQYYYAGPGDGKKREAIIIKYIDGKKIVVDKAAYAGKVLRYASLLKNVMG